MSIPRTHRAVVVLVVVLGLWLPALTSFAAATVSLSPSTGAIGSSTTVSGGGFAANTTARVLFGGSNGSQVGSESTDGSGTLPPLAITIPSVTGGAYQVFVTDGSSTATADFQVPFSLNLNPSSGAAGTNISVSGTGFLANESIKVGWDQASNQVASASADGSGGFSTSFAAPGGTDNHVVFATGQTSGFVLATSFLLSGAGASGGASLSINPASGAAGTQVNLSASGFTAGEQINLTVDGTLQTTVTADSNGKFTTSLNLPSSLNAGSHSLGANGVSSGRSATVAFDVTTGTGREDKGEGRDRGQLPPTACPNADDSRPGYGRGDDNHCHTGPGDLNDEHGQSGSSGQGNAQGQDQSGDDHARGQSGSPGSGGDDSNGHGGARGKANGGHGGTY